jgi:predicted phosphoribosyltransferase
MIAIEKFPNRIQAGRLLATLLEDLRGPRTVVLGLARGGVVVAREVADHLEAPLGVLVARKIGAPQAPEFALGAIAPGARVLDQPTVEASGVPPRDLEAVIAAEERELARRMARYQAGRPDLPLENRVVILVDDGLATGRTAQAAIESVRRHDPRRVVYAAPVCSREGRAALRGRADDVVCLHSPEQFFAVGEWYEDFSQTSDEDVLACLSRVPASA